MLRQRSPDQPNENAHHNSEENAFTREGGIPAYSHPERPPLPVSQGTTEGRAEFPLNAGMEHVHTAISRIPHVAGVRRESRNYQNIHSAIYH